MRLTLYHHLFMHEADLPPMPGPLTYIVAANGLHLWAKRDGLEVLIPVQPCLVRDLYPVTPFIRLDGLPPVPASLLTSLLTRASSARQQGNNVPLEMLFFLSKGTGAWNVAEPPQLQEPTRVTVRRDLLDPQEYARVLLEIHTHPQPDMPAFFSATDDEDACGFRLDAVIGRLAREPGSARVTAEIRMRVVVYDVNWAAYEFPASWVLSLPDGLEACRSDNREASEGSSHAFA